MRNYSCCWSVATATVLHCALCDEDEFTAWAIRGVSHVQHSIAVVLDVPRHVGADLGAGGVDVGEGARVVGGYFMVRNSYSENGLSSLTSPQPW